MLGNAKQVSCSCRTHMLIKGMQTAHVHAGYIKLQLPVFHIGYFKNTLQILQVCNCFVAGLQLARRPKLTSALCPLNTT